MVSKAVDRDVRWMSARAALLIVTAVMLALSMVPAQAWAYFNRGSVSVALGATALEVQAGSSASVTLSVTPSSDEQTEGCGMPKCPQGCSETCTDENGQCRCAGTEYRTYYPTAVASSSNASVAVAVCSGGTLTVYGRQEGEATITVRASLRQFTDAETTLSVKVSGSSDGASPESSAFVELPEVADAMQEDRADVVEKTVMGRPIRMVRIADSCDARTELASLAGMDGDVTFWQGDTYYHPRYSLTFLGSSYDEAALFDFDPSAEVLTEASGTLNQLLSGLSEFVVVNFAQKGKLPAAATVYAEANGAIADDQSVALFSYDSAAKAFVRESAAVSMSGGYATFSVEEGKTYVVSSRDLTSEANVVVTGGSGSTQGSDSCCSSKGEEAAMANQGASGSLPPFAYVAMGIGICAVAVAAIAAVTLMRRKRKADEDEGEVE